WIAESEGLFLADFSLLTRIPGLEMLDIVATDRVLASGFDERVHEWWPGVEDVRGLGIGDWGLRGLGIGDWGLGGLETGDRGLGGLESGGSTASVKPVLLVPHSPSTSHPDPQPPIPNPQSPILNPLLAHPPTLWWTYRDREEELIAVARQV